MIQEALANGIVPSHNVSVNFEEPKRAKYDAEFAREMGFLRMWSIHPTHIDDIFEGMQRMYTEKELTRSTDLLLEAQEADWGPIAFNGKMEDRATYRGAWSFLKRARAAGVATPQTAEERFFNNNNI